MSELISYQFEDGIATLTLNNGKVNAISPAVIDAFNQALDQALQDKAVVIVTGQPGILSGGYDLKVMTSGPENAVNLVAAGSTLARRLLSHPYPVIVACPGHAVAKGAFLLLSADYRIGVDGPFQIGLNRSRPRHDHAPCRHRTGPRSPAQVGVHPLGHQCRDVQSGRCGGCRLPRHPGQRRPVAESARAAAQQLKKLNMTAHRNTKLKVRKALLETLDQAIELDKKHLG